ncbi:cold-inducible protein YdjO-related protein [Paenibacillus eucommiae]|uniref:cold-inducible protein YdjO-related protein n=1 Tax=Paenibacillus eucommiae TaxID=1355755 RepID=UPI001AE548EC|nr:cold-inducible protein YdjO-related protein [Paenibacillus eucommiae]
MRYFPRPKKDPSLNPGVETTVWACTSRICSCWMRVEMSFEHEPACPLCGEWMTATQKTVPKIINPRF